MNIIFCCGLVCLDGECQTDSDIQGLHPQAKDGVPVIIPLISLILWPEDFA